MRIWFIETQTELNCAWTKKKDAIAYIKEEAKQCGWNLQLIVGSEEDDESYVHYTTTDFLDILIYPTFLDEKPYE